MHRKISDATNTVDGLYPNLEDEGMRRCMFQGLKVCKGTGSEPVGNVASIRIVVFSFSPSCNPTSFGMERATFSASNIFGEVSRWAAKQHKFF